jgi:hypothetical protein
MAIVDYKLDTRERDIIVEALQERALDVDEMQREEIEMLIVQLTSAPEKSY